MRKSEDNSGNFKDTDILAINENFSSNFKRVTLPAPVIEEAYKKEIV